MFKYKKISYRIYFIVLLTTSFSIILISNIGGTTINIPYKIANIIKSVSIQGWGFFTRNPREETIDIFAFNNGNPININSPNFSAANYFGLSRKSRKIGFETSLILQAIKETETKWQAINTKDGLDHLLLQSNDILLPYKLTTIKDGWYILTKKAIIPWAWFNKTNNFIPYEAIRIHLKSGIKR